MAQRDELSEAQQAIVAALAQHTAYSYRASSAVVNRINEEIDRLSRELAATLSGRLDALSSAELQAFLAGKYTTSRLKGLRAEIDAWGRALDEMIRSEWEKSALALAGYEAAYMAEAMRQALDGLPKYTPKPDTVLRRANQTPLMGRFVSDMLADLAPNQRDRVYATVRQGVAAGQTNNEIIRALRGTKALKYQDGIMQAAKRDVERLVRTARNHIADVASEDVFDALGVEYVVRVATLEGRTCVACAGLDGKVYRRTDPRPPATLHPNCRCRYAPSFDGGLIGNRPFVRALKVKKRDGSKRFRAIGDMTKKQREDAGLKVGQVKAGTAYPSWFANQDAAYQKEWLGSTRYKLYKEGKLPIERFSDPLNGKAYTIEQLRQRDAEIFKAVFGET